MWLVIPIKFCCQCFVRKLRCAPLMEAICGCVIRRSIPRGFASRQVTLACWRCAGQSVYSPRICYTVDFTCDLFKIDSRILTWQYIICLVFFVNFLVGYTALCFETTFPISLISVISQPCDRVPSDWVTLRAACVGRFMFY
jgi:hypothetical protein